MTDGELVRRVVAGETAAYEGLARRWYCRILAYCQARLIAGCRHDAEDLTQEVLIRGFTDLGSLTEVENFGPWLRGIANHVCADWGRERRSAVRRSNDLGQQTEAHEAMPVDAAIVNDERSAVMQQLSNIPEELREVILLHYYEHLTYDEMARWLGVARATVNERLSKARALLRVRLVRHRSNS